MVLITVFTKFKSLASDHRCKQNQHKIFLLVTDDINCCSHVVLKAVLKVENHG